MTDAIDTISYLEDLVQLLLAAPREIDFNEETRCAVAEHVHGVKSALRQARDRVSALADHGVLFVPQRIEHETFSRLFHEREKGGAR
jgi:hypothetical protein